MNLRLQSLWFRLLLGFGIPLLLFFSAALVSSVTIQNLLGALIQEQKSQQIIAKAYDLNGALLGMVAVKRGHHLLGDEEFYRDYERYRENFVKELRSLQSLTAENPEHQRDIVYIGSLERRWRLMAERDFELFDKLQPDQTETLRERLHLRQGIEHVEQARRHIAGLISSESQRLHENAKMVQTASRESFWVVGVTSMLAVFLSIAISFILARSITRPINMLHEAANRLRSGRFLTMAPSGPEELRELIGTFNMMGTALSEREDVLQTSETRFRAIVGDISQFLWTMDRDGAITAELLGWASFTGQDRDSARGLGWLDAIHPEDRKVFLKEWKQAVDKGNSYDGELRIRESTGEYRHFSCRIVPVPNPHGEVTEWVCSCTDITERKEQEELRKEKEAAEAASRAKSEFLAKMSHELRTPLNAIIGMSKMLATQHFGKLNEKQADYLSDVIQAGEHLLSLINDILDLSKVEAGRMNLSLERVPLGDTIATLISTVRGIAESRQLHIRIEPPEPDGSITTDLARFKQILFNLVSNAIKFTPANGSITVRCQWVDRVDIAAEPVGYQHAQAIRIDIEDTGVGIAEKDLESIWKEFSQVNPGAAYSTQGTGLGLALTRRLTNLLRGKISVCSQPNEGSCFSLVLPIQGFDTDVAQTIEISTVTNRRDGPLKPLVLIIDDYEPTNKLLRDWLKDAGLHVESAYDGKDGLERARALHPDLVVLDMRLPRLDGWHVLSELRSDPNTAKIPVLILSVLEGGQSINELEIVDWLVKPIDRDEFMGRLHRCCPELFQHHRELCILAVDQESQSRQWLRKQLEFDEIELVEAASASEALNHLKRKRPDLMIVDLMMPDMDGFSLIESVRSQEELRDLPILVLTAKDITTEDWERLSGKIDAILRKDALDSHSFYRRLRSIGISLNDGNGSKQT